MNKKISVVILNWNGASLLEQFLPSVIRYSPETVADVIVADNGSTDNSLDLLRKKFPGVGIIQFEKNHGFAEGYNKALSRIETPFAVLLNSDIEVTEGWLDAPLQLLEKHSDVACVQPKICSWSDKGSFEYAGAAGGFIDKYGYPFCRGRIFSTVERDCGQYDSEAEIVWASGASLFVRTDVYRDMGGLDATFFAHQEEIDLCWRIRNCGWRILFTHKSVVYHLGGGTLNADNPHKTWLNFRNNLLMLYKNLPEKELDRVLFVRFWLDYLAAFKFFLCGQLKNALAVYKARSAFRKLKPEYALIRRKQFAVSDFVSGIFRGSILFYYYLKGKKRFTLLPSDLYKNEEAD